MNKKTVRKKIKKPEQLDYSKLPNDLETVIAETLSDITEKEANINFDGKQYLVRFPNDIANAIGIKKGDKIKFRVELPSPKTNQQEDIKITYIRSEKRE
ncbi:MAG: hypothetical protein PHP92_05680 [Candidatus Nanoarchaeia archaeon]|nr:hypothetical protein [Candidatus Nanoarchaeia archaeon]